MVCLCCAGGGWWCGVATMVFGDARTMWLAVEVISCKNYGLKRKRVEGKKNVREEKNY